MPRFFLHLSPSINQPLCHSAQMSEGGIMSSYLFCTKMKYLSGVNTYQEQTIGQGASSSQTHIWLPPPQRPKHVLRVFSDSGKSASFESTFQSPCWTERLCWNWRETCVHTAQPIIWWSPRFPLVFDGNKIHNFMLLSFSHVFILALKHWFYISMMKPRGQGSWFMPLRLGSFPLKH